MNPEVKAKWVSALRSGEYTQTKGFLHNDNGFCCLGVLCEIAVADKVIEAPEYTSSHTEIPGIFVYASSTTIHTDAEIPGIFVYDDCDTVLPESVETWSGFDDTTNLSYAEDGNVYDHSLIYLNDDLGLTFHQIADLIEKQL